MVEVTKMVCPKCGRHFDITKAERMPIFDEDGDLDTVIFECPHCHEMMTLSLFKAIFE